EARICIRTSQPIAVQPIADADAPAPAHGETADRPTPAPSVRRASDSAAAAKAPATTAPHDMPDELASFPVFRSAVERSNDDERIGCAMSCYFPVADAAPRD